MPGLADPGLADPGLAVEVQDIEAVPSANLTLAKLLDVVDAASKAISDCAKVSPSATRQASIAGAGERRSQRSAR